MTDREKLIELLGSNNDIWADQKTREKLADHLIENGVVIQKHGLWNDGDPYCPVCGKDKFGGLDADVWADWKPDYCPNCGARMDGGTYDGTP